MKEAPAPCYCFQGLVDLSKPCRYCGKVYGTADNLCERVPEGGPGSSIHVGHRQPGTAVIIIKSVKGYQILFEPEPGTSQ